MRNKWLLLIGLACLVCPSAALADGGVIIDLQGVVQYDGSGYAMVDASGVSGNAPITGTIHFDDGLWIEEGATNLLTNPSFETNTTGWTVSGLTVTRTTTDQYIGNASAKLTGTGGSYYLRSDYMPVTSGLTYTLQAMIAKVAGAGTGSIAIRWFDASYTSLLINGCSFDAELHPWQRYTCTRAAPATAVWAYAMIRFNGLSGSVELYADALSFSQGLPTTYSDGDRGPGYAWTGAAHASTSTRAATTVMLPVTATLAGNADWSARLQWTPAYSAIADWPDTAILFAARGQSDNYRVTLSYAETDDAYHVYINGGDRMHSSARTWAAGEPLDLWLTLDFDGYARIIENGVVIASANIAALSPPANIYTVTLGSNAFGELHANALYQEFALIDSALTPAEAAAYAGDFVIAMPPEGEVLLQEGLYSYWDMDELSGIRYDSHESQHLTDNNTVLTTTGILETAALFDSDNYEYLSFESPHLSPEWTLSGWASPEFLTSTGGILGIPPGAGRLEEVLLLYTEDDLYLDMGTPEFWLPTQLTTGWQHLAIWYESGRYGVRIHEKNYTIPAPGASTVIQTALVLGDLYDGALDEFGLWERLLSAEELLALEEPTEYSGFETASTPAQEDDYQLFLPLVMNSYAYVPDFTYPTPTPESPYTAIDYSGDTSWSDWAETIEGWFAPLFIEVAAGQENLDVLRGDVCGAGFDTTAGFLPGNNPDDPVELELGEDPTILDTSYSMGIALGRPFGYIRAFYGWLPAINNSYNVAGINFFVMLMYFLTAGIGWIVFVVVVTYSMYFVRTVIAAAIQIYELIPLKST